ncbi:MAG: pyruvate kinase alpha/beta domain-containing protein [Candidatus Bathyarchaeia archaeon]
MTVKSITYFDKPGSKNTDETLNLACKRASELGIRDIVVASTHGKTALKAAEVFDTKKNNVVAVTISEGFRNEGWTMTVEERKKLQDKGIKVLTCIHALGGDLGSAFTEKNGGTTIQEAICQTLYRF